MTGDSTGVFVHEGMFPLRVLAQLVPADPKVKDASDKRSRSFVRRLDPLFRYETKVDIHATKDKGKQRESEDGSLNNREILTYESPVEGTVCEWCVKAGDVLENPYKPILRIIEPCKHPVQLGGLCAVCGKDLTAVDYTGFSETSRANIQMTHDSSALTVSLEEADRIERQTSQRLVKEKKLSLIVDLDQTVIQATVDPTVGDWMHDPKNPNYPALRDVQRFRLLNDAGREDGCWYYVKPRPTLPTFLKECAKMYEMHVYTMGTRQYAENVCKIIDPDGKIFSTRILSRDESGSMVHKSLERLFPVDQSMVVVIDDRADVWAWSPNLVKVVPYDFFIGTGDINGAFLPRVKAVLPPGVPGSSSSTAPSTSGTSPGDINKTSTSQAPISPSGISTEEVPLALAISEQNEALDHQVHDKPLAKMQEEKSAHMHAEKEKQKSGSTTPTSSDNDTSMPSAKSASLEAPSSSTTQTSPVASAPAAGPPPTATVTPVQAPAKAPLPTPASNGIGASRFVSKSTLNDTASDSESSSDESSGEEEAPATKPEEKAAEPAGKPLPIAVDQVKDEEKKDIDIEKPKEDSETMQVDGEHTEDAQEAELAQEEEAVLKNNDEELDRVLKILSDVHDRFFDDFNDSGLGVPDIIPDMKRQVLRGCHIVFSGVIPLDQDPKRSELWRVSEQFGASLSSNFTSRTTHLVAAKAGTSKVNSARRRKDIHIVTPAWLLESVARWSHEPEELYFLDLGSSGEASESISNANSPSSFHGTPDGDPPDETAGLDELESIDELEEDDDEVLHDIDWGDAEAEIQAALDETDDDDDGMASQSDAESTASGPTLSRKRGRHSFPPADPTAIPVTGSPLSKRRKVAAERAGKSKLKMSESLLNDDDSITSAPSPSAAKSAATLSTSSNSQKSSPRIPLKDNDGTTTDDDDLDDFAKALEGELS